MLKLKYDRGTLIIENAKDSEIPDFFKYDKRSKNYRTLAYMYDATINFLSNRKVTFIDEVFFLIESKFKTIRKINLYSYQREALDKWFKNNKRGIISLPTGAGKTRIAIKAMAILKVPTLIVVPTLDLINQWEKKIRGFFETNIGIFGGGKKSLGFITISTYDSAYINAEYLGNRFKFLIFDEVHHLPSPSYRQIAELNAAPFRLGLSATPEREDLLHLDLPELVGPIVYERKVSELSGRYISGFEIILIEVNLLKNEKEEYDENIDVFRRYLRKNKISMNSPRDFEKLVMRSGIDKEARKAILAWRKARKIAFNSRSKIDALKDVLEKHRGERIIIFTENNEMVRFISKTFLIPELTYKTPLIERKELLEMFRKGEINVLVTSRILEEGVDIPDASIAIVLSGSGSKREFIQRLGRILRAKPGKKAFLYEIVSSETNELAISYRRRRKV